MKYGAIKVGVRNMNSNVRPTIYLKKISHWEYVIQTPNGDAQHSDGSVIVFRGHQMDKARAMVKVIRNSFK